MPGRLKVGLPCSPVSIIFEEIKEGDIFVALQCSALRFFRGGRTDVSDVASWLTSSFFRYSGFCSSAMVDVDHPASGIPGELYGRYLIPGQSQGHILPPDERSLEFIDRLIGGLDTFERLAHNHTSFWHPDEGSLEGDNYDAGQVEAAEWALGIAKALGRSTPENDIYNQRLSADWLYYRTSDGDVAVLESAEIADLLELMRVFPDREVFGVDGFLYAGPVFDNFIPREVFEVADRIFELDGDLASSDSPSSLATVIPLENAAIIAQNDRAIMLRCDSGVEEYKRERSLILERNRREQELLFPPEDFFWSEKIDGGRFERLVYDLLEVEPGVREVRSVGAPSEGDGGRDLLVSWTTPSRQSRRLMDEGPLSQEREVIVQCKARKKSVGRSDLGAGILDTLFRYRGEGYFLVSSSQIAVAVIDLLKELEARGDYFVGWWSRIEIESRLRKNPQILKKYSDVVRPL
ncbi:hypothetical protein SUDANB121_03121 [Nocardiopsis dassonvillei]